MSTEASPDIQPIVPRSISSFLIKTAIVVAAIICILFYVDTLVENRIDEFKRAFGGGRAFWTKVEKQLDKLADPQSDLPPEKRAKIISQIRVIADRWRPFVTEIVAPIKP